MISTLVLSGDGIQRRRRPAAFQLNTPTHRYEWHCVLSSSPIVDFVLIPFYFPLIFSYQQWRSPEEARGENNLTEKVDVFSMGHIFFRLICGHEPWNKLEPGGKPSKDEINAKVQKGILPTIPDDVMNSKDEEVIAIRDAMLQCYSVDPTKRPSAYEITQQLSTVLETLTATG